mmetsp:Transcript_56318/g.143350  ORF Transcript_56318/g.143350 Transcript_56318/m.143350 type:complete len:202 (-) Transcript_56318:406-1011(-)
MLTASERQLTSRRGPSTKSSTICFNAASTLANASSIGAVSTPGTAAAILTVVSSKSSPKAMLTPAAKESAFCRLTCNISCTCARPLLKSSSVTLLMLSMIIVTFWSDSVTELAGSSAKLKPALSFSAISTWPTDTNAAVASLDVLTTAIDMLPQRSKTLPTALLTCSASTLSRECVSALVLLIFSAMRSLTVMQVAMSPPV